MKVGDLIRFHINGEFPNETLAVIISQETNGWIKIMWAHNGTTSRFSLNFIKRTFEVVANCKRDF